MEGHNGVRERMERAVSYEAAHSLSDSLSRRLHIRLKVQIP